jgi:hypothetical protein
MDYPLAACSQVVMDYLLHLPHFPAGCRSDSLENPVLGLDLPARAIYSVARGASCPDAQAKATHRLQQVEALGQADPATAR